MTSNDNNNNALNSVKEEEEQMPELVWGDKEETTNDINVNLDFYRYMKEVLKHLKILIGNNISVTEDELIIFVNKIRAELKVEKNDFFYQNVIKDFFKQFAPRSKTRDDMKKKLEKEIKDVKEAAEMEEKKMSKANNWEVDWSVVTESVKNFAKFRKLYLELVLQQVLLDIKGSDR